MTRCPECESLNRVFESKRTEYLAARSAVLYRISTEFATRQQVDMEPAKSDMEDHLSTRSSATKLRTLATGPVFWTAGTSAGS